MLYIFYFDVKNTTSQVFLGNARHMAAQSANLSSTDSVDVQAEPTNHCQHHPNVLMSTLKAAVCELYGFDMRQRIFKLLAVLRVDGSDFLVFIVERYLCSPHIYSYIKQLFLKSRKY